MKYSLLIVEDEPLEEELLEDMIRENYPQIAYVYSADNGIDALRLTQKKNPDIVLLDINIPGITGIEYLKEVRKNHFCGQIIMTTAYDSFQYARESMKYGAAGYLLKPVMDRELFEYMEKCFGLLEEQKKQKQMANGMESICSYAQSYLIRDFLSGSVPERAMKTAYGWPDNGQLQAGMVKLYFDRAVEVEKQQVVTRMLADIFQPFFRTIQSMEGREAVCIFQPQEYCSPERLELAVWCAGSMLVRHLEKQAEEYLIGLEILYTKTCATYQELQKEADKAEPFKISLKLGDESPYERRMRISKAVCRMKEGNARRAVNVFHTMIEKEDTRWGGVCLLLRAVLQYREDADVMDGFLAVKEGQMAESWNSGCNRKCSNQRNRHRTECIRQLCRHWRLWRQNMDRWICLSGLFQKGLG